MFNSAVHFLTLVAFAAHAVFGCCGHHQHRGIECCQTEHVSSETHADGCADSHCSDKCSSAVEEGSPPDRPHAEHLPASDAPCGHGERCNEARCSFTNSSHWQVAPVDICCGIVSLTRLNAPRSYSRKSRSTPPLLAHSSTPAALCAALQSWQI